MVWCGFERLVYHGPMKMIVDLLLGTGVIQILLNLLRSTNTILSLKSTNIIVSCLRRYYLA